MLDKSVYTLLNKEGLLDKSVYTPLNIIGLFADPYFIQKVDDLLFFEDTRPIDTLSKKAISISQEQSFLEENINQSMEFEADSCNSSVVILSDGTIGDISTSSEDFISCNLLIDLFFYPFFIFYFSFYFYSTSDNVSSFLTSGE